MGVSALWDTIKRHQESIQIAQLAEDHHRRHGRPLRIAVDEADWRFNNLTPQQVYKIRETSNEPAFQGIEKAMFYRICRLLTLNIQLIFVFDGPGRPWKRGKRGQGMIKFEERRLLQEMLRYFGIPYHEAPGEAEAECARMQVLGLVDAIWSQDSDCLLFGCTLWLYDHRIAKDDRIADRSKENTKKQGKYANMVRARDLEQRYNLDREGFVLFAMLVGGDYDEKGLPQCGPGIALQAVKKGLGKSLCACRNQRECDLWSAELAAFLNTTPRGRAIPIPPLFPDYKTLTKYYSPKVTSDLELLEKSRLNLDYSRPIQEHGLLQLISERFNIWGRLYMNWVGPVLLTRDLVARDSSRSKEVVHGIRLTKQWTKNTADQLPMRTFERKLTFSPFGVTSLCKDDFEGSQLGHWNGDKEVLSDEEYRVECEIPEYWLRKALPADVLDPPPSTPKSPSKRKRPADNTEDGTGAESSKRRCISHESTTLDLNDSLRNPSKSSGKSTMEPGVLPKPSSSTRRASPPKSFTVIELSDSEDDVPHHVTSSQRKPVPFPNISFNVSASSGVEPPGILIDGEEIGEEEYEDIQLAIRLSMQEHQDGLIPPPRKGKYDDIFAMREAARNMQESLVPAWSLDQPVSPTSFSRRPRSPISAASTSYTRVGTHANAAGLGFIETPTYPLSTGDRGSVINSGPLAAQRHNVIGQESDAPSPSGPPPANIRAARLRHFASSTPVTQDTSNTAPSSPIATTICNEFIHGIPVEVECIDLTDD